MIRIIFILFFLSFGLSFGQSITGSTSVSTLVGYADAAWDAGEDTTTYNYSNSGCHGAEMYYAYWNTEANYTLWKITGDSKYINRILLITQNMIDDAVPVVFNSSYLGWKSTTLGGDYNNNGVPLYESYYFKLVSSYLRDMYNSPTLRATAHGHGTLHGTTYQDVYDEQLAFIEEHIWNKWFAKGLSNIYRSHTHMSSHWARIAMNLYIITGTAKYATHRDDFDFDGFPSGTYAGYNMRDQIQTVSGAYKWVAAWGGSGIQDSFHLSDIIAYMVESYELGVYWDSADMTALVNSMKNLWFQSGFGAQMSELMDGTGGYECCERMRDNAKLGRFDATLNGRINTQYISNVNTAYDTQYYSIAAENKFVLDGSTYFYPEGGGTGDIPEITVTGSNPYNLTTADTYSELGAVWTDTEDGTGAATVGGDTVDESTPGTYVVTYDFTDSDSNAAAQKTRTVNVSVTPVELQIIRAVKIKIGTGGGGAYLGSVKVN